MGTVVIDPVARAALRVAAVELAGGALGSPAPTATALALDRARLDESLEEEEGEDEDEEGEGDGGGGGEMEVVRLGGVDAGDTGRDLGTRSHGAGAEVSDVEQLVYYTSPTAARLVGLELGFDFALAPTVAQMKINASSFVSIWMLAVTATWPQRVTACRRKHLAKLGIGITGGSIEASQSDVSAKTWSSRIMVACAFANFVGRTICMDPSESDVSQEEMDRRVKAFFTRLTLQTRDVITAFLDARRHGIAVCGSTRPVKMLTMEAYSSALSFMFESAHTIGVRQGVKIVPDCEEKDTPWQLKAHQDWQTEKTVRECPGTHRGNPMATATVKSFKTAASKDARLKGEQSVQSAPVTPEIVDQLYNWLFMRHLPADAGRGEGGGTPSREPATPSNPVTEPTSLQPVPHPLPPVDTSSMAKTDFMVYFFYVMLWTTLARPIPLLSMKFGDVSLPDLTVPRNLHFFNRYCACHLLKELAHLQFVVGFSRAWSRSLVLRR